MGTIVKKTEYMPNSNWREFYGAERVKFDDNAKLVFLEELAHHSRILSACKAAGVSYATYHRHLKLDQVFAKAVHDCQLAYRDRLIEHHQDLVFNGTERVSYDRAGQIVSTEKIYPIQLIAMELRKHDEGYRDKKEVDVNVKGGVVVAPAAMNSIEEWEAKYGVKDDDNSNSPIIEGEVVDSNDEAPPLLGPREDK